MSTRTFTTSDSRRAFPRPEAVWYLRHAAALARWPVLPEQWAREIEEQRLAAEAPGRREDGRGEPR